jgi:hypothetical protein
MAVVGYHGHFTFYGYSTLSSGAFVVVFLWLCAVVGGRYLECG